VSHETLRQWVRLMPGGKEMKVKLDGALSLDTGDFEYRWAVD